MKRLSLHYFLSPCLLSVFGFFAIQCSPGNPDPGLTIISGSENRDLEPLINAFARKNNTSITVKYAGSVDISREIEKGKNGHYDAVWPAASIWLAVGDQQNVCKHAQSIMRSPVVFGLKKSIAGRLGWTTPDKAHSISLDDLLAATQREDIRFAMTSATQSNSGASWFLGSLAAFAKTNDPLQSGDLAKPEVRERTKQFLGEVDRSSGSSGWLMDFFLEHSKEFDGMVNYEVLVLQSNAELERRGEEPLYLIYPKDGLTIADSPLAYINKGDPEKEQLFLELQKYLLSEPVQNDIAKLGRRTDIFGQKQADSTFKPEYGVDLNRILSPVPMPSGKVIREALGLYQTVLRKPSLTAFVVDYSGSMENTGEKQLEEAMRTLLDQNIAAKYLLQGSADDHTFVVPFSSRPHHPLQAKGNDPGQLLDLYRSVEKISPGGGTDLYKATEKAYQKLRPLAKSGTHHAAIIVMSDGRSSGSLAGLKQAVGNPDIPVFTILFGSADPEQMNQLAEWGTGRMFDGRKDVIAAFRKAKGYN